MNAGFMPGTRESLPETGLATITGRKEYHFPVFSLTCLIISTTGPIKAWGLST
jgi:hypothetical protein